jgi:hypothetical protein
MIPGDYVRQEFLGQKVLSVKLGFFQFSKNIKKFYFAAKYTVATNQLFHTKSLLLVEKLDWSHPKSRLLDQVPGFWSS